ncbi:hypothetical protein [Candidatus Paracaedibacter symbiosus]|uniref:hypothetical protein n=1 Tax=Candidatus Paracaedibacter symbiosus TaxID=244582 RepID=UPI0005098CAD|nr:hypothetical protein [Candidatus Paracaedibacter symbiosus]
MTYIPFPSLKTCWYNDKSGFTLSLPWVTLEIDVTREDFPWIEKAIDFLHIDNNNEEVQKFLGILSDHSVAYINPRTELKNARIMPNEVLQAIPLQTPWELAGWVLRGSDSSLHNLQLSLQWQWRLEEICQVSQIEGTDFYDPVTVITFLRGLMLEADATTDQFRVNLPNSLDLLRQHDEKKFFEFMKGMLRQTHYITQKFQEYAPTSLGNFPEAADEITQFLKEEKGHDKLMEHSLKVLGCENPTEIDPSLETTLTMDIFKKAIEICPMAFVAMVGFFEGGEYGESDPIADILKKSSLPEAALGYQRHFEINRQENHNNMVYTLAQKLPLQTYESVLFTVRALELVCYLASSSDRVLAMRAEALIELG